MDLSAPDVSEGADTFTHVRSVAKMKRVDPITLAKVSWDNAYYIRQDAIGKRIRHIYQKGSLDRLFAKNQNSATSPITGKRFHKSDVLKTPFPGRVHPDLEGKKIQTVLRSMDTKDHVAPRLHMNQRVDILMDQPNMSLTIQKVERDSPVRRYKVNIQFQLDVYGKNRMDAMLDAIASVLDQSTNKIHVTGSRLSMQEKK